MSYDENTKYELVKNVFSFKEKQELFNYIFKRKIVELNEIKFSDGIHEDIRYVVELLLISNNIEILDSSIYKKIDREDSITKELNLNRIDGYLTAIKEIVNIDNQIIIESKNEIVSQCLGTILYIINKSNTEDKAKFLDYLQSNFSSELRALITERYNKNNTNFKYAVSLFLKHR